MPFRLNRPVPLLAAAAVGILVAGAVLHRFSRPEGRRPSAGLTGSRSQPPIVSTETPAPPTAADWMARIQAAKASGRPGLMKDILSISDAAMRDQLATALAAHWMAEDLDGYLAFVDGVRVEKGVSSELMGRFSTALLASFEAAGGGKPLEGKMRYVAEAIVEHLLATNPAVAEAWCREFLVGADRDTMLARIAPALVASSPEKAMEVYAGLQTILPRLTAATEMGEALARHDPSTALRWARSVTAHSERALAMAGVASGLAAANPGLAASSFKDFLERIQSEYTSAREADRQRLGIKPADEFETPELYQQYLADGGHVLSPPDTPEADYVLKAGETIARQLAAQDPVAALAWAESLSVSLAQAHAIKGALSGWSQTSPQQALDYYQQQYAYDPGLPHAIFHEWAQADPEGALQGIERLPSAAQQSAAISGLTSGWLDSGAAVGSLVDWSGRLPAGPDRDSASLAIISRTGATDSAAAWRLVQQISSETARHRAAKDVLSEVAAADPAAARALLQGFPAPPHELESLGRIVALAEKAP